MAVRPSTPRQCRLTPSPPPAPAPRPPGSPSPLPAHHPPQCPPTAPGTYLFSTGLLRLRGPPAVDAAGGNIALAARRLGVGRNTIYRKLRWGASCAGA